MTVMWCSALWCRRCRIHRYVASLYKYCMYLRLKILHQEARNKISKSAGQDWIRASVNICTYILLPKDSSMSSDAWIRSKHGFYHGIIINKGPLFFASRWLQYQKRNLCRNMMGLVPGCSSRCIVSRWWEHNHAIILSLNYCGHSNSGDWKQTKQISRKKKFNNTLNCARTSIPNSCG